MSTTAVTRHPPKATEKSEPPVTTSESSLRDPLDSASVSASETLEDPLAASTVETETAATEVKKKTNPDPSLTLTGAHKTAGDVIKTTGDVARAAGQPATDVLGTLGVDESITEHIKPGFDNLNHLATAADGANRLSAVIDGTSGLGMHEGESAVHNTAERAVGAIGGIKTMGTGLADATMGITNMIDDPVIGTDENGEDKTLTSEIGTGKTAFGHVADAASALATAIKKNSDSESTEESRAHATLTGLRGVANSGGSAARHIADLANNSALGTDIELGSHAAGHIASIPTTIMDATKKISDKKSTALDKTETVGNTLTGVTSAVTSAGKNISTLSGADDIAANFGTAHNITGGVANTFGSTMGVARGFDKILDAHEDSDTSDMFAGTAEVVGHSLNTSGNAIKLTNMISPVAEEVLENANTLGTVGTGIVGLATMASTGEDAFDEGEIAVDLRDEGDLGDDIDETVDVYRAKLAKRFGINMKDADWEEQVDDEAERRLEKADDNKADFYKLIHDPDFEDYLQAKSVDEIREYAQLRKIMKAAILTTDTIGKGLSSIGTATAAADGGATKIAGSVLGAVPAVAKIADSVYTRLDEANREVDATDVMNGYNKTGAFGRIGEKVGGAFGAVADAVSPVTKPIGKGLATAGRATYDNVLAPTGRALGKAGSAVYDNVLAPTGRGLAAAGGAVYKHALAPTGRAIGTAARATYDNVLAPTGRGIAKGAGVVYDNVLAPTGRAVTKAAKATWRGVEKTAGAVGGGVAYAGKKTWGGMKYLGGKIGGLFSSDDAEEAAPQVADNKVDGDKVTDGSKPEGETTASSDATAETKPLTRGQRFKNGVAATGRAIAKPFKAFGQWFKEDVWETRDMKWARKVAAAVRGPKVDQVRKQWDAAKKDKESPEGKQIRKLEANDFETFLEIQEAIHGGDHITERARDLAALAEGIDVDPEVRADAIKLLEALEVAPEKHGFERAMPKIQALKGLGIDPTKMSGPSEETLAKHPEGALAIKDKKGKPLSPEAHEAALKKQREDISKAKQARLVPRIEAALGL